MVFLVYFVTLTAPKNILDLPSSNNGLGNYPHQTKKSVAYPPLTVRIGWLWVKPQALSKKLQQNSSLSFRDFCLSIVSIF